MARIRTRGELLARSKREAHLRVPAGATGSAAYSDEDWNRAIADAWAQVWYEMTQGEEGYGLSQAVLTGTAGPTLDLPVDFLDLRALRRGSSAGSALLVDRTSAIEVARWRADQNGTFAGRRLGWYYLEGPNTGVLQRVRFFPDIQASEVIVLDYVTQEPGLGDPADTADDTISIDVLAEPVEMAIVTYARRKAVTREDLQELGKAEAALREAIQAFIKHRQRRNRAGGNDPNRYGARTKWMGY